MGDIYGARLIYGFIERKESEWGVWDDKYFSSKNELLRSEKYQVGFDTWRNLWIAEYEYRKVIYWKPASYEILCGSLTSHVMFKTITPDKFVPSPEWESNLRTYATDIGIDIQDQMPAWHLILSNS